MIATGGMGAAKDDCAKELAQTATTKILNQFITISFLLYF